MSVRALENGFHPIPIGNGAPDQGWPCKKFKQEVAPMEEVAAEPTLTIADILECLPEAKKIIAIVDQLFIKIHPDKNLEKTSNLFKQITLDNQNTLNAYPIEQKVQIFFALYKKLLIPVVEKYPEFSAVVLDLQTQFPQERKFLESTRKLVDKRIYFLHADFVRIAIMGLGSKCNLARESSPEHVKIAESLNFSKNAEKLFESLQDS